MSDPLTPEQLVVIRNVLVVERKLVDGLPLASSCPVELVATFEQQPPEFPGQDLMKEAQAWYGEHARRLADALQKHTPGGFVDALLGELLHRKACIFRVTGVAKVRS